MAHDTPTAPTSFERVLPARVEEIATLAADLAGWAQALGVPAHPVAQLNLALDELVTNTVVHGYAGTPDAQLRVQARLLPGVLEVVLLDHAPAWDPLQAAAPDLEADIDERAVGGLGVHFVRMLADEVEYSRIEDGGRGANRLRLAKRLG